MIVLSSIEADVKNWVRNQNLTDTRFLSAFNQASDIVFTQLGLPTQEKQYLFAFDETQPYYSVPTDFLEPLGMRYDNDSANSLNRDHPFTFTRPIYIYPRIENVTSDTRMWSVDYETGKPRMIVLAPNTTPSMSIDDFDGSSLLWTATEDATGLYDDYVNYLEGAGSMGFNIVPGLSVFNQGKLTRTLPGSNDWSMYLNAGEFKVDCYIPNITNFTSVTYKWFTDAGDYYTQTVYAQQDGTAFVVGWNYLEFDWSSATQVGTPDPSTINTIEFDLNYTAAYTGGSYFRLDNLRLVIPDTMIMTYYTQRKGTSFPDGYTSAAGATSSGTIITVTDTSGLEIGMVPIVTAGAGQFFTGSTVTNIYNSTTFSVSVAPTVALSGGASVIHCMSIDLTRFQSIYDVMLIDTVDIGLRNLFTIYTAVIINPQILVEDTQASQQYKMYTDMYLRRYPKRRINNLLINPAISRTD